MTGKMVAIDDAHLDHAWPYFSHMVSGFRLPGIRPTANTTLSDANYDFSVFDTPESMHTAIESRNGNNRARVVAGYCWDWFTKSRDPSGCDIVIGDNYKRRWNLDTDGSLWIVAPDSIAEVGCIHTCQGLELEYVGVIIGPDLVVRDGELQTVPTARARHDRTMKGCYVYCTDPETAEYFRKASQ